MASTKKVTATNLVADRAPGGRPADLRDRGLAHDRSCDAVP